MLSIAWKIAAGIAGVCINVECNNYVYFNYEIIFLDVVFMVVAICTVH